MMAERIAMLVAQDVAPSKILRAVVAELKKPWQCVTFLGDGEAIQSTAVEVSNSVGWSVGWSDVVLCGMSANERLSQLEIHAAREAQIAGKPFGFVCDTWGCHARPWFQEFRESASFVFHMDEVQASLAHDFFPNAEVVASGNPEDEDYFTPKASYEEVRGMLGVAPDETMILCAGHKEHFLTLTMASVVMDAAILVIPHLKPRVFVSLHPGDPVVQPDYKGYDPYEELAVFANPPWNEGSLVLIVNKDPQLGGVKSVNRMKGVTSSFLIDGADIVIGAASTVEREAGCRRKPVISLLSQINKGRNIRNFSQREWEPCLMGISWEAGLDYRDLGEKIAQLLRPDGYFRSQMKARQEELLKPREKGSAVRAIIATLEKYV